MALLGAKAGYGRLGEAELELQEDVSVVVVGGSRQLPEGHGPLVAAGGQFDATPEPTEEDMVAWLKANGLVELVPQQHVRRAYLAFSRCPFGAGVT